MITQGKYKRIASDEKPLSEEGLDYLQARVDHYYAMFVDAVSVNRSIDVEDVLKNLADGSTHIGTEALAAGFVDHVGNLEFAVERALELIEDIDPINSTQEADMPGTTHDGAGASGGSESLDLSALTAEQLAQHNPELAAEMAASGVNTERGRVLELLAAGGSPEQTMAAVKDGTPSKDFYKQVLDDERSGRAQALDQYEQKMKGSAGQDGHQVEEQDGDEFDALVKTHMDENQCSKGAAIKSVARKHPQIHAAWLEAQN
jgi:hypothetical protein